jgi:hypothetical protein
MAQNENEHGPQVHEQLSDDEGAEFVPRTLREFNVPRAGDVRGAIRLPRVAGNQPNFNPGVVNMSSRIRFMAWIMKIHMPMFRLFSSVVQPLRLMAQQMITLDLLCFLSLLGIRPRNG